MTIAVKETDEGRKIKILARLKKADREQLMRVMHKRDFRADDVIYQQGQPAMAIFFILQGSVGLFKSDADQRLQRLKVVPMGDCFGAAGALAGAMHHESAIALEPVQVLAMTHSEWSRLLQLQPTLAMEVFCGLYQELLADWHAILTEYHGLTVQLTKANIII